MSEEEKKIIIESDEREISREPAEEKKSLRVLVFSLSGEDYCIEIKQAKEVIRLVRDQGIKTDFLVGGAVVTEAYAASIGAFFAKDGVAAVRVVDQLMKNYFNT